MFAFGGELLFVDEGGEEDEDELERCRAICLVRDEEEILDCASVGVEVASENESARACRFGNRLGEGEGCGRSGSDDLVQCMLGGLATVARSDARTRWLWRII